jgi:hypothetical protein
MTLHENEFHAIRSYGEQPSLTLEDLEGAFTITFERNSLSFKVTVAYEVLEWFVEIIEPASGLKFEDGADYSGYDRRPREELVREMTEHLHRLFSALMSRTFRLRKGRTWWRASDRCEWLKNGRWIAFNYGDT